MKQAPYQAPDFSLVSDDDTRHRLADYRGEWLVLYFYPKDDTPGCTMEACSIRDSYAELQALNGRIVGVSMDTPEYHRQFKQKYDLPFTLLSDPMGETIRAYGAWGKKLFGREGILRKTFIIDPDGMIIKIYGRVTPAGHGDQIARQLGRLQSSRQDFLGKG